MSANQKIPKGTIALGIFLMLLIVIEVLVVNFLTPGMPVYFYSIGIFFMILGIIILFNVYRKYKAGAYSTTTVSGEAVTPSITPEISDKKLFRGHLYAGIVVIIIASMLFGLSSAPFTIRSSRITYIVAGVFLLFGAILNFIIYGTKPEKLRQKYLEKRAKKAAK